MKIDKMVHSHMHKNCISKSKQSHQVSRKACGDLPDGQWLRPCAHDGGGPGLIPGLGTRSHMLQLRVYMLQLKISHATTKI